MVKNAEKGFPGIEEYKSTTISVKKSAFNKPVQN